MNETTIGPRLTDERFFGELVNCTLPGLEDIPQAAAKGDYKTCRHLFAEHIRASLDTERFFRIRYEKPENAYKFIGESDADACVRVAGHELISCSTPCKFGEKVDYFANPTYNGYKEWTWQLSRHPEWKMLAHQYNQDHNELWAKTVAELFDMWVKQATVPDDDVEGGDTKCWRTIECGIRMGASWPYTLFTFYKSPYFTDDILTDWYKSIWEHGHRLHINHRTGNWLIMEMNGLGQIGILYPELKDAKMWLDYATRQLMEELDRQVYPDGFQYELATGYHYVVINNYLRLVRTAQAFDVKMPDEFITRLENMLDVYVRLMRPSGNMPNLNDGGEGMIAVPIGEQIEFFPNNKTFRWIVDDRKTDEGKPDYTSVALPYAGMAVMRTGWGKDDVWGFLDAAPFGRGHQHEDKLNFLMHAHGRFILTECGTYSYDDSEMRRYALSTRSHNTVRVNSMDQNRRVTYSWKEEEIRKLSGMQYRLTDDFDYAAGVYDEGYGDCQEETAFKPKESNLGKSEPAYMGATHSRSVVFIKKPANGLKPFFIVTDRMTSEDENDYEILWHVDAETVSIDKKYNATADFLHVLTSLSDVREDGISIISAQRTPEWQGWMRGPTGHQRDDVPLPTIKCTAHGTTLRVVTVLYPEADCPIAAVKASKDTADTTVRLVMNDGTEIVYNENDYLPEA